MCKTVVRSALPFFFFFFLGGRGAGGGGHGIPAIAIDKSLDFLKIGDLGIRSEPFKI